MFKFRLCQVFVTLAIVLIFGLLIWISTLHGALAMLRRDSLIRSAFVVVGLVGLLLLGLAIWHRRLLVQNSNLRRWLLIPILLLTVLGLLIPGAAFSYVSGYPYSPSGELPPRLLIQNNPPQNTGSQLHFAASSDAHFGAGTNRPAISSQIIQQIADPSHGFSSFFSLGDLVELGAKQAEWQEALIALGPITSTIPTGFVPGNHDTLFNGIGNYRDYSLADQTSGGGPLYYRVDVGTVHFLILDVEWSAETFDQKQSIWLENQLKGIPAAEWKIVLSHGYYYSSGFLYHGYNWYDNPETIRALTPLFEKYRVDLVLSGHNHQMEYLQKNGVTYLICGALGGQPDPNRSYISPASQWYAVAEFGFLDILIEGSRADITFRNPQNQAIKSFTLNKP